MYSRPIVLASDDVSRNKTRFSVETLHQTLLDTFHAGAPHLVSHDAHRLAGWIQPRALYFEPGRALLLGEQLLASDEEERAGLEAAYRRHLSERLFSVEESHAQRLREFLVGHVTGDEDVVDVGATALVTEDLARRCCPSIFDLEDDDGLVPLRELQTIIPGVYRKGEFAVFAHAGFRRSLSRLNNLNADLLAALDDVRADGGVGRLAIRLDPDLIGLASLAQRERVIIASITSRFFVLLPEVGRSAALARVRAWTFIKSSTSFLSLVLVPCPLSLVLVPCARSRTGARRPMRPLAGPWLTDSCFAPRQR